MSEEKNEKITAPANVPNPAPNANDKKSKMKTCDSCGKEYAKSAKACPYCGAKNKKPWYKRWWLWLIIAVVIAAVVTTVVVVHNNNSTPEAVTDAFSMSEAAFKSSCKEYDYRDIMRDPDAYYGKHIKVKVCINQDLGNYEYSALGQSKSDVELEQEMKSYGEKINESDYFSGSSYYLTDYSDYDTMLVEDDVVTIYGVFLGTASVEYVLGNTADVPNIGIIYATIEN